MDEKKRVMMGRTGEISTKHMIHDELDPKKSPTKQETKKEMAPRGVGARSIPSLR